MIPADGNCSGCGIKLTLQRYTWWPDIERFLASCEFCGETHYSTDPIPDEYLTDSLAHILSVNAEAKENEGDE